MTHCDSLNSWVIIHDYHLLCCSACLSSRWWCLCPSGMCPSLWATPLFSVRTRCSRWAWLMLSVPQLRNRPLLQGPFCYRMALTVAFWGEDVSISSLSHGILVIDEESYFCCFNLCFSNYEWCCISVYMFKDHFLCKWIAYLCLMLIFLPDIFSLTCSV